MNTAEKIKEYRLKNAWSQEQLAQLASLSVRTIQRIEGGQQPGLETLSALASVFEVPVSELSGFAHHADEKLNERICDAKLRVAQETGFFRSLIKGMVACVVLMILNYALSPHSYWSVWVALIWGALLVIRAVDVFFLRNRVSKWQNKRVQRLLRK